jgi:hypothetical protein
MTYSLISACCVAYSPTATRLHPVGLSFLDGMLAKDRSVATSSHRLPSSNFLDLRPGRTSGELINSGDDPAAHAARQKLRTTIRRSTPAAPITQSRSFHPSSAVGCRGDRLATSRFVIVEAKLAGGCNLLTCTALPRPIGTSPPATLAPDTGSNLITQLDSRAGYGLMPAHGWMQHSEKVCIPGSPHQTDVGFMSAPKGGPNFIYVDNVTIYFTNLQNINSKHLVFCVTRKC